MDIKGNALRCVERIVAIVMFYFIFAYKDSFSFYFRCKPAKSSRMVYQTWL